MGAVQAISTENSFDSSREGAVVNGDFVDEAIKSLIRVLATYCSIEDWDIM